MAIPLCPVKTHWSLRIYRWDLPFLCVLKEATTLQYAAGLSLTHLSAPRSSNASAFMLLLISLIVLSGQGTGESLSKPRVISEL